MEPKMIELKKVGAHAGKNEVSFGIYLPEIKAKDGYKVKVRVIHARDLLEWVLQSSPMKLISM
jgi:hypothetical protein